MVEAPQPLAMLLGCSLLAGACRNLIWVNHLGIADTVSDSVIAGWPLTCGRADRT